MDWIDWMWNLKTFGTLWRWIASSSRQDERDRNPRKQEQIAENGERRKRKKDRNS